MPVSDDPVVNGRSRPHGDDDFPIFNRVTPIA